MPVKPIPRRRPKAASKRSLWRRLAFGVAGAVIAFYLVVVLCLLGLKRLTPFTTAVQIERRVDSWFAKEPYTKRYSPVPVARMARDLRHAVVAAEDARFYKHHGFDWVEIRRVVEDEIENGRTRGASTITQQLVKNLFLTTWRSPIRKSVEATIVPLTEWILGKERILELYLNVIEWGPGVFGAEAAARHHYNVSASHLSRDQALRLAAIIPSPLRRRPARMDTYGGEIDTRMRQMGW